MTNFSALTSIGPSTQTLSIKEKGDVLQARVQEIIQNASMEIVRERMPQYVPIVEKIIESLDYKNPLTIAQAGSWALEDQAAIGMGLIETLQQEPSGVVVIAIDEFEKKLRKSIAPLQTRIDMRAGGSGISRFAIRAFRALGKPSAGKALASRIDDLLDDGSNKKLKREINELRASDAEIVKLLEETMEDAIVVKNLIGRCMHVPALIQESVTKIVETNTNTAEALYLTLVAVNEYRNDLQHKLIPEMEEKAWMPSALAADIDDLQTAKKSLAFLETRSTDLTAAVLSTCMQRGMALEMGHISASSSMEMERINSIVMPQMVSILHTLCLQQRASELALTTRTANRVLATAVGATADGAERVLAHAKEADEAKLQSAYAVVAAAEKTVDLMRAFHEHEKAQIEKQREARRVLAESVGKLSRAAADNSLTPEALSVAGNEGVQAVSVPSLPSRSGDVKDMFKSVKGNRGPKL